MSDARGKKTRRASRKYLPGEKGASGVGEGGDRPAVGRHAIKVSTSGGDEKYFLTWERAQSVRSGSEPKRGGKMALGPLWGKLGRIHPLRGRVPDGANHLRQAAARIGEVLLKPSLQHTEESLWGAV